MTVLMKVQPVLPFMDRSIWKSVSSEELICQLRLIWVCETATAVRLLGALRGSADELGSNTNKVANIRKLMMARFFKILIIFIFVSTVSGELKSWVIKLTLLDGFILSVIRATFVPLALMLFTCVNLR